MLKCGLLGKKLGHSYSPQIHKLLADYEYRLYEKTEDELEDFLKNGDWNGLNVTIPYKKTVVKYCKDLSSIAKKIGSVNTLVKREDGSIYGDNTDAFGFSCLMKKNNVDPEGKKVLVLGSGGASVAVLAVLEEAGAKPVIISRSGENNYENLFLHKDAVYIVNTTPVGMYPNNGESPIDLSVFPDCRAVLDIVYNPARTALTLQAESLQIPSDTGLYMLVAQAKRSSELFSGKQIPDFKIEEIQKELSISMKNIILIGMPGCGKSTIAQCLAEKMKRDLIDTDEMFHENYQISAGDCILQNGEAEFRRRETEILKEAGKQSGKIISTGGGCVTVPENYPLLHQNGMIVWIDRKIEDLPTDGRPLSVAGKMKEMYEKRKPLYQAFADITVVNDKTVEEAADKIKEKIYEVFGNERTKS